jgi:hypothetical protein
VLLAALALTVSGCAADEPPAAQLPPATSEPSPTVSSVAAEVEVPPEAREETAEGASAFARFYLEILLTEAFHNADASRVRALTLSECEGCDNLIGLIEQLEQDGERMEGGEYVVAFAEASTVESGDAMVDLGYRLEPGVLVDREGRREALEGAEATAQMRLSHRSGTWSVRGFRTVSSA